MSKPGSRPERSRKRSCELARYWKIPRRHNWQNGVIPKGTTVYAGSPGLGNFYFRQQSLDASGLDSHVLSEGLQISPHPIFGYRPEVTSFVTTEDTPAAFSKSLANPTYGSGGLIKFICWTPRLFRS